MRDDTQSKLSTYLPWLLFTIVIIVPFVFWFDRLGWRSKAITELTFFPILGIWAWGIMWTHYAYGALRIVFGDLAKNRFYSRLTNILVLALILIHPTLLIVNQWQTRKLLPPESMYGYVDSSLKLFVFFGTLGLLTFLSFEVFERIRNRQWVKRNWHIVSISQMVAMTLIFVHGLALGANLNNSWLEFYWVVLGALLIPCFGLIGRSDWRAAKENPR